MPIQSTLRRPQSFASGRARRIAQRVNGPMIGQSFDIEISRDADGWMIRIPEIGGTTRTSRRAAVELAASIAANGPLALIATKEIATGGGDWAGAEKWEQANALMAPVFGSQDAQEGARAFAEKRPPVWKGQ